MRTYGQGDGRVGRLNLSVQYILQYWSLSRCRELRWTRTIRAEGLQWGGDDAEWAFVGTDMRIYFGQSSHVDHSRDSYIKAALILLLFIVLYFLFNTKLRRTFLNQGQRFVITLTLELIIAQHLIVIYLINCPRGQDRLLSNISINKSLA